eukprot:1139367-Pelagomonas_calceolata.AAC.5
MQPPYDAWILLSTNRKRLLTFAIHRAVAVAPVWWDETRDRACLRMSEEWSRHDIFSTGIYGLIYFTTSSLDTLAGVLMDDHPL